MLRQHFSSNMTEMMRRLQIDTDLTFFEHQNTAGVTEKLWMPSMKLELCMQLKVFHSKGLPAPLYVVEITVFPWKPKVKTEKGQHRPNLHPVYEDEEGKCYFRRQASLMQYSVQEVVELTKQEVHNHFKPLFSSIKEEMKMIKEHYFSLYNHTEGS